MKIEINKLGFTLTEVLVVMAIIGILAGMVVINLSSARVKGRDAARKSDLKTIQDAVELARETRGSLPGNAGQIYKSIVSSTNWIPDLAPKYVSTMPVDPKNSATYYYLYAVGSSSQAGAYYLEAKLEGNDQTTISVPTSDLTAESTYVAGIYNNEGARYFRVSNGPN